MRHPILMALCVAGVTAVAGCGQKDANATVERAFQDVDALDGNDISEVMLTVADPNEAITYFQRATTTNPDRIDHQRGLAASLVRAKRATEGAAAWKKVTEMPEANADDSVELADALIRSGDWAGAERVLDAVPPTHETFKRYRLEAIVADSNKEWKKADSFYQTAVGLTTTPGSVMNNWGYSKLTRGDYPAAERLFSDAIRQDGSSFTAKNNLILARAAQRDYTLPVIPMDQSERAQLLHTMALSAVKQGDVETGKGLLREAIDTHPQHFEAAVRSLRALENG
ncbi:tetratricopeptide repeat protein [Sulfitobacter geojensis]|uniref:tetratricopeptide repeat protein n=1 Tax=Sulfitobacter geojensis TaxID=1342299 RepID=UPI0004687D3E|nr:tetratricopeptide repeat protein [Sulfitobacter geojensis]KHA51589.1 putative Lipoprotein [Sulfitobacter geojensis]NYI29004.1 Flp pilus assembly protein TadD [Sulfitobacter geojensis]